MTRDHLLLKEVEHIEVTTIIDNYVDVLLESSGIVTRPTMDKDDVILTDTLLAEHGLSLLLKVSQDEDRVSLLFDTGHSQLGVLHNFLLLGQGQGLLGGGVRHFRKILFIGPVDFLYRSLFNLIRHRGLLRSSGDTGQGYPQNNKNTAQ